MSDEIYKKLAKHLASLGMGYPQKEELLQILRENFTPLEAEVALAVPAKVIRPTNPLDLGDLFDFDLYIKILEQVLQIDAVNGILFQHGSIGAEKEPSRRLIQAVKEFSFRYQKPVALKVISPEISHKSDRGGVFLDITDSFEAEKAFEKIKRASGKRFSGVLIQKMIPEGMEVILGAKRDPSFGPVVLFGLGGIYVEILKENSLRVAPISRFEAEEMISESKASAILKGARGKRPLDTKALVESLLRLSHLMIDFPEIEGIDINPVMVQEKGAMAVDARISLA